MPQQARPFWTRCWEWLRRPWRRKKGRSIYWDPERRGGPRIDCGLKTSHILLGALEGEKKEVPVRNISPGGISLLLTRSFDAETVLALSIINKKKLYICKLQVRVVYVVEHPRGFWIMGGAFTRRLTDEELNSLLA